MNITIPPSFIKGYLEAKLPDSKVAGNEYRVCSFLAEDDKYKLYINLETGLWTDFKAHQSGNLYKLISLLESIPYSGAKKMVANQLWDSGVIFSDHTSDDADASNINVVSSYDSSLIENELMNFQKIPKIVTGADHPTVRAAHRLLQSRKLPREKFLVCLRGRYKGRLIVPYFSAGELYYFQARSLNNNDIKYLNPGKSEYGVKASELLYPFDTELNYVVITEGPIDAIALQNVGINATSVQGSFLSTNQARRLAGKRAVVLSFDNDQAGRDGMEQAQGKLLECFHRKIAWATPPHAYKDWNDFISSTSKKEVREYFLENIYPAYEDFVVSTLNTSVPPR